jgi:signal transduction histidine kinase
MYFEMLESKQADLENNTNYVTGIVHDLRSPMTAISSCFELIDQIIPIDLMTDELSMIILSCKKSSDSMISMISNILDYAKLSAKKFELDV